MEFLQSTIAGQIPAHETFQGAEHLRFAIMLESMRQNCTASDARRVRIESYLCAEDIRCISPFDSPHATQAVSGVAAERENVDLRDPIDGSVISAAKHVANESNRSCLPVTVGFPERADAFSFSERSVGGSPGSSVDSGTGPRVEKPASESSIR
jgi:hypothetical protein